MAICSVEAKRVYFECMVTKGGVLVYKYLYVDIYFLLDVFMLISAVAVTQTFLTNVKINRKQSPSVQLSLFL